MGLPAAMISVLTAILAANWFRKDETATAFSAVMIWYCLGGMVASIFTVMLPHSAVNETTISNYSQPFSNHTSEQTNYERTVLLVGFASISGIMFLALILTYFYALDHPPTSPSVAQEKIMNSKEIDVGFRKHLKRFTITVRCLFKMKPFLLLTSAIFFRSSSIFPTTLLSSLVLRTFPELTNTTPGIILLISLVAGICGGAMGGRILDRTKAFKEVTMIGKYYSYYNWNIFVHMYFWK